MYTVMKETSSLRFLCLANYENVVEGSICYVSGSWDHAYTIKLDNILKL